MSKFVTAQQLIDKLKKVEPNRIIVMASDAEGNSYAPLDDFWTGNYNPEWQSVGIEKLTDEDRAAGYTEEDVVKGRKAIILCPRHC